MVQSHRLNVAQKADTLFVLGYCFAVGILFLVGFLQYRTSRILIQTEGGVALTHEFLTNLEAAYSGIQQAESGTRAFVATGHEDYFDQSERGLSRFREATRILRVLVIDNSPQEQNLDHLMKLTSAKERVMTHLFELRREQGATAAIQELSKDEGLRVMIEIRNQIDTMEGVEDLLLESRTAATRNEARKSALGIVFGSLLALTIVVVTSIFAYRDTRKRRQFQEDLKRGELRLNLALDSGQLGIWDLDFVRDTAYRNLRHDQIFGFTSLQKEWGRKIALTHVVPEDQGIFDTSFETAIKTGVFHLECRVLWPDRSVHWIRAVGKVIQAEGGAPVRMSGIVEDITKRKQMEQELEASRSQMVSTARLSALGMMAGGIAHEINNPLAIIHASASNILEMAESGDMPAKDVEGASRRIKNTATRIGNIVTSLRLISRDGSSDPFHWTPASVIVDRTLELCKEKFRIHLVRLDVPKIPKDLKVFCREVQVSQVLLNLLQNALDAVGESEGDRWVTLEVEGNNEWVKFAVTDSGPGIRPQLRSRIMEPFFTTKAVGKGTGLGLCLSKAIIEDHGGVLKLDEGQPQTCFSFVLPIPNEVPNGTKERHNLVGR